MASGPAPARRPRAFTPGLWRQCGGLLRRQLFESQCGQRLDWLVLGASPLGLYSRAYNLLMLPVRQLSAPLSTIMVPALSRLQDDPERFARYYLRTVNLIAWIATPLFGFLIVAAEPVVRLVLGDKWLAAAPVFEILAIGALAQMLFNPTIWLFVCQGQSDRMLKLSLILTPVFVGSYILGLPFGIKGVALSGSLVFVGIFPWILKYAFRGTNLTLQRLGEAILRPISVCLAGVFSSVLALHVIAPRPLILQLVLLALSFVVGCSFCALIPGVRGEILNLRTLLRDIPLSRRTP